MSATAPNPASAPAGEQRPANGETNPYRGPQPLTIDDRLFGRDKELAQLESLLLSQRIVLLYAASGVGKTSLLQAGLCRTMRNRGFDIVDVVGFRSHTALDAARQSNRYEAAVVAALGRNPGDTRLLEVLDSEAATRQLFVLDQFEELFTIDHTDWPAKRAYMATLAEALNAPNRWAAIAFREEYVAEIDAFVNLFPGDLDTRIRLEPLSAHEAVKAIVGPAEHQGVPFDIHLARDLARLLSTIEVDASGTGAIHRQADAVEPIHLQLVCHRLWRRWRKKFPTRDRITAADVASLGFIESIGDVERVLGEYYNEVIDEVSQVRGHERVIRDWFDTLIATDGHRAPAKEPPERATAAMGEFESRYLIRRALGVGPARYELAHDRLARAVPEANRERLSVLEPLYGKARTWSRGRHRREDLAPDAVDELDKIARANPGLVSDEEIGYVERSRKERDRQQKAARAARRRRLLAALGVLVVVMLLSWGWSTWRSQGETARDRDAIQRAGEALLVEEVDPGLALQMAVDAADQIATQQQVPAQLRSVLHRFTGATPTRDVLRTDSGAALLSTAMVAAPDADVIATGTVAGTVLVSTGDQSSEPSRLEGLLAPVRQLAVATDGSVVAAVDAEGDWRIWKRTSRWVEVQNPTGVDALGTVRQVAIRPGEQIPFALSADGRRVVDLATGESIDVPPSAGFAMGVDEIVLWTSEPGNGSSPLVIVGEGGAQSRPIVGATPTAAAFSPDGERLVIGTQDGRVLDRFGRVAFRVSESEHAAAVDSVVFVDDDLVVSAAADGLILWSLERSGPEFRRRISHPSVAPAMIAPTATSTRVWALTEVGTVEQWVVSDGHRGRVVAIVPSDGGLLTRGSDGTVLRWNLATLTVDPVTSEWPGPVVGLAARGNRYVLVDDDDAVVFDGRGESSRTPVELDGNVTAVELLEDATVVLGDDTGTVSVQSPRRSTTTSLGAAVTAVAANEAGTEITVGTADGQVVVLGAQRLEELAAFPGTDGAVTGIAILPATVLDRDAPIGEEVIVVGAANGTITAWLRSVATTPAARMTLAGSVLGIDGDPGTRRIVATSTTGHLSVWQFVNGTPAFDATIRRTRPVTATLIDDGDLWVGDDEGLVADVALSDAELIAYGQRVSAWEPASVQVCERRGWLDDCPLDPDRADDLRAVRQALLRSSSVGVEDPAQAAGSSAASDDLADRLSKLVEQYVDAVDAKDWEQLRVLTFRDDLEDAALELAYGDLATYSAFYVGATESGSGTARLSVGAVRSFTADGLAHVVGSCEIWIAHLDDDPHWIEEVPDQTVQVVDHIDDLPTAREVFDESLLEACQG